MSIAVYVLVALLGLVGLKDAKDARNMKQAKASVAQIAASNTQLAQKLADAAQHQQAEDSAHKAALADRDQRMDTVHDFIIGARMAAMKEPTPSLNVLAAIMYSSYADALLPSRPQSAIDSTKALVDKLTSENAQIRAQGQAVVDASLQLAKDAQAKEALAEATAKTEHDQKVTALDQAKSLSTDVANEAKKADNYLTQSNGLFAKLTAATAALGRWAFYAEIAVGLFLAVGWLFPAIGRDFPAVGSFCKGLLKIAAWPLHALHQDDKDEKDQEIAALQTQLKAILSGSGYTPNVPPGTPPLPAPPIGGTGVVKT